MKHISVIADELVQKNDELKRENTSLKQENADLREALAHCQSRTYGNDLEDGDKRIERNEEDVLYASALKG